MARWLFTLLAAAAALRSNAIVLRRAAGGGAQIAAFLETKAQQLDSVDLTVLSHAAMLAQRSPEGLDKVKDMIRGMIVQKQSELASHTTRSHYCDSEMPKAKEELRKVKDQLDETCAEHDKLSAKIAELKDENDDLFAAVAKLQQNISESQAQRDREHAAYAEVKARYEASHPEDTDEAMKAQIKVETEEADRSLAFRRWHSDASASIKEDNKKIRLNNVAIIKMSTDIAASVRDEQTQRDLLQAVEKYQRQLEKQCVVRTETYEERKQRRDQEIESMRDAYETLGGAD